MSNPKERAYIPLEKTNKHSRILKIKTDKHLIRTHVEERKKQNPKPSRFRVGLCCGVPQLKVRCAACGWPEALFTAPSVQAVGNDGGLGDYRSLSVFSLGLGFRAWGLEFQAYRRVIRVFETLTGRKPLQGFHTCYKRLGSPAEASESSRSCLRFPFPSNRSVK